MNPLTDLTNKNNFIFPTILEYSLAQVYAKRLNDHGQQFSINKVFINNGDQFNSKHIIEYFKKTKIIDNSINIPKIKLLNNIKGTFDTSELHQILDDTEDETILIENINIMSCIGLLSKKEYTKLLDQSSNINKMSYLRNKCNQLKLCFKPHLLPLQRPTTEYEKININDYSFKVMTTLFDNKLDKTSCLVNCEIISKHQILFKLMQNSITIFDITNDSESELQRAKISFSYIYNELIKYDDDEIVRCKEIGIIRKFILISTVMTWAREPRTSLIQYDEADKEGIAYEHILDRLPITKYKTIFEFEKLVLKSNTSKIKDIFKTYVIGTGIIYGYEENAFHHVFTNAWNNTKEMYTSMLNRMVPVFHIDELAKIVCIISMYDSDIKYNYIFAVEQVSFCFNHILKTLCDNLCSSRLVSKEDVFILNQYKFNSFTWDLICSDLIIDPMLDIVIPDYQTQRPSIIFNMKDIILEFIEANNLYSLKLIVSGQSAYKATNIAKRLAQYYKVQLINIPNLIENYKSLLKDNQIELELKINNLKEERSNIIHSLHKLIGQSENQRLVDKELKMEMYYFLKQIVYDNIQSFKIYNIQSDNEIAEEHLETESEYLENSNYFENIYELYIKYKNELLQIDKEINNIKSDIKNLNAKYEEYESNISMYDTMSDNIYLWSLIKELLSLSTCRNQGFILNIFPLSIEQIELIFNKEFGYPNFIVLIIIKDNTSIPQFIKKTTSSININRNSKYLTCYYPKSNSNINSHSSKIHQTYENSPDFKDTLIETNISDNLLDTIVNNKHIYEVIDINNFTNKGINILSLNLPLKAVDETGSYNVQFKDFTDTIIAQIGRFPFRNDIFKTMTDVRQITETNQINKTQSMSNDRQKKVFNKLSIMKEQWNNDIMKAQEREKNQEHKKFDKNQEHRKSDKIHHVISTNYLPRLLMEISSIGNETVSK